MDALIFVDTNIYLDFYRARSAQSPLSILDRLADNVERTISTSQVEMEYLKNRQDVILESLKGIKTPEWQLTVPAIFAQAKPTKALDARRKDIDVQLKRLRARIEAVLRTPSRQDPVFRKVWKIFRHSGPYVLGRDNDARASIRRQAWRRFALGYPPRKDRDTTIGDAVNWEWMLRCVADSGKHLIIVSRDSDYGRQYSKAPILNDWLRQEFKERISSRRKVVLTDRLSEALKLVSAPVTQKEEASEAALIADVKTTPSDSRSWTTFYERFLPADEAKVMSVLLPGPGKTVSLDKIVAATGLTPEEAMAKMESAIERLKKLPGEHTAGADEA